MFTNASITLCNNGAFNPPTIRGMDEGREIHPSMGRLYEACGRMRGINTQSAVARLLNESPQVVKNWEARGISERGALAAQKIVGCDAVWLLEGGAEIEFRPAHATSMLAASDKVANYGAPASPWPFERVTPQQWWHDLKPRHRKKAEDLVLTYIEDHLPPARQTAQS